MAQETKHITLVWQSGLLFEGGEPGGPTVVVDADNKQAPGPMLQLLLAAASCSAADVVAILEKMRQAPGGLRLDARGTRREEDPRRFVAVHLAYHIHGDGLEEEKVRRAIELSIEKYCSVLHSLAPDIAVTYDLFLG